jgi:hypothetical protein
VLRRVAPRLLAEAVLDGVEGALLQLVHVLEHLDVRVQVHHALVLHQLPDAELGVVDHVVGHGEPRLALRLDVAHDAALAGELAAAVLGNVGEHGRHHQRVRRPRAAEPLGKAHHAIPVGAAFLLLNIVDMLSSVLGASGNSLCSRASALVVSDSVWVAKKLAGRRVYIASARPREAGSGCRVKSRAYTCPQTMMKGRDEKDGTARRRRSRRLSRP